MNANKLENLKKYLSELQSCAIAFSGGVDSTFLLKVAKDVLGDNVIAITIKAFMNTEREFEEAIEYAKKIDVNHLIINIENFDIKEFIENNPQRCYYCKKAIFTQIIDIANLHNIKYVLDGTNIDDLSDYRPGIKALEELKIISPLKELGITKNEIRSYSKSLDIPTWDKPSFACLASRVPYGDMITKEKLEMIEKSEEFLISLGFKQMRVRHHGEIARIEVQKEEMNKFFNLDIMNKIVEELKKIGFKYITLDLLGYRSGSMNEILSEN